MPVLIVSGLLFLWPELAPKRAFGMDGLMPVAVVHDVTGIPVVAFTIAHMCLATTGVRVTSLVRMMITGWHEHDGAGPGDRRNAAINRRADAVRFLRHSRATRRSAGPAPG